MGSNTSDAGFLLRFECLQGGPGLGFPCDSEGHVDLNQLSEPARNNYLYARAMMGREFAPPVLETPPQRTRAHGYLGAALLLGSLPPATA